MLATFKHKNMFKFMYIGYEGLKIIHNIIGFLIKYKAELIREAIISNSLFIYET